MSKHLNVRQRCAAQHFGLWMIETQWFTQAVAAVKAGVFQPYAASGPCGESPSDEYLMQIADGIAHISIIGQMSKGESSFGGASTVQTRRLLRSAAGNPDVSAILLHIDSPGGTMAGTAALADDVKAANASTPVYAHIEDRGASAAYWVGSQARRLTADRTSEVGSIGTMAYVMDTSKEFEQNGWTAHIVSTGGMKGAFADGVEITPEQLDYLQQLVNDGNEHFLKDVAEGRKADMKTVRSWADGRIHDADKARKMGLIDAVSTVDEVIERIRQKHGRTASAPSRRRAAENRLRLIG